MLHLAYRFRFLFILSGVILLFGLADTARAVEDFGQMLPGQRVYDRADVLTPDQEAELERKAAAVTQAGAPTVVYLRPNEASYDETFQDAQELMDAWDVQSSPGARDGFVMFFNLKPDDRLHGQAALYAGQAHADGGNLPPDEAQRIFDDVMKPLLSQGELAAGIGAGLDAAEQSLRFGPPPPPPPSAFEELMGDLSRGPVSPLNLIALLLNASGMFLSWRAYSSAARPPKPNAATTQLPSDLAPALAGALVVGRVKNPQLEATVLDLARRDAIAIEPAGKKRVQLRLLDSTRVRDEFERLIWDSLAARAEDGIVPTKRMGEIHKNWDAARKTLESDLEQRGWYDSDIERRRRPSYLIGVIGLVLSVAAFIVTVVAGEPWGALAIGLLLAGSLASITLGYSIPSTTREGAIEAIPWLAYRAGIQASKRDPLLDAGVDLDEAMPYAVAMETAGALDRRLKAASAQGYAPAWLGPSLRASNESTVMAGGFYPYWIAFHSSVTPTSSGGGVSTGGASSGGGGGGGSF